MKILSTVLLASFLLSGHQAIAKENPPEQKVGNWTVLTQYDDIDDSPSYNIYSISRDGSTVISLGCTIDVAKNGKIVPLASFFTKKMFQEDFESSTVNFQYGVDDKPFVDENFDKIKGGSSAVGKIMTVLPPKIQKLFSNLHDGKNLIFSFNNDDQGMERQKFDIKGFNQAFEKIKAVCKF